MSRHVKVASEVLKICNRLDHLAETPDDHTKEAIGAVAAHALDTLERLGVEVAVELVDENPAEEEKEESEEETTE